MPSSDAITSASFDAITSASFDAITSASFDAMWAALAPIGRNAATAGYRRFAWTREDGVLREWFAGEAARRGLDLTEDRAGNQWAWWGSPDRDGPGVVIGSHLDSVPDGGAFDGPLGVVSSFCAVDALRAESFVPGRPIAVVNFAEEEGARFGIACAGSRLITGELPAEQALARSDSDGITLAEALTAVGRRTDVDVDTSTLQRIGVFVELHVEQGRGLVHRDRPVAVGSSVWPHGRWRLDLLGEANHAGTTRLEDRHDPMVQLADVIRAARSAAAVSGGLATIGKVQIRPNGVNAIPSAVTAWLDARGPSDRVVDAILQTLAGQLTTPLVLESRTADTHFDAGLVQRLSTLLDDAPVQASGAGHDAGVLAGAGIPAAMLFVRNPTGVSHSPAEYAERDDCLAGIAALTAVVRDLAE